jgi:pimeloyl-ACP methyl ester carboxylesterase
MEICSQDVELETTFRNWLGPKNESTYDLCKRLYNGLTDRVCRPPRKVFLSEEYDKTGWFATHFNLRTSLNLNLACIYYEKKIEGGGEDTDDECCFKDCEGEALEAAGEEEGEEGEKGKEKVFAADELIVIYMHTNTSCMIEAKEVLPVCNALNASLVCYDLRGHGKSEGGGLANLQNNLRDLEQVVAWARSKSSKMILWARGAATCVATRYQALLCGRSASNPRIENPIKYLVLDSPFISVKRMYDDCIETVRRKKYGDVPSSIFSLVARFFRKGLKKKLDGMDPFDVSQLEDMPELTIPAFFLIAVEDDYIPPQHGMELASQYGGPIFARMFQGRHFTPREEEVVMGTVPQIMSSVE